ncbi:alpha/beta hydrolase [Niabella insulamsoli]|uniref:alpha/beta hydrolase n=1 Tax=Niabella insulamsoli TaxID=3144874 RepID=UPI0031FC517D
MKHLYYIFFSVCNLVAGCGFATQSDEPIPVHDTFSIPSKLLREHRVINVWAPEAYKMKATPLPVIYMADGGIQEDFPHLANTLSKLIEERKVPPAILVGIQNTQRRRDLTGPTNVEKDKEIAPVVGGAAAFRMFIKEELFPEIGRRYQTTVERTLIGESAAGLFVMETFFLAPEMFDNYIAFDPSLWWNNHYLVTKAKELLKQPRSTEKRLWFAGSNATDIAPYTRQLAETLKTENPANLEWRFADEPNEKHTTIFKSTKEKAIIWTLGNHH